MIATRKELDRARDECRRTVTRYAAASGAAGAIPLPGLDLAVDVFSLARLLTRINERFGLTEEEVGRMDAGVRGLLLGAMVGQGASSSASGWGRCWCVASSSGSAVAS